MARTRLFGALKRWARLAWIAERQRRPTHECVEQVSATWQSTRREALHAAMAATAMAALPFTSCTSAMRHHNGTERVAHCGRRPGRAARGVSAATGWRAGPGL